MGPSLLVNCYLEIKFHKKIRVNPPPPSLIAVLCRVNHLLSDLDVWYSGSLDMYLEKVKSGIAIIYSIRFLKYEVDHFKKFEFEKVNLIIQEPSEIK